MYEKTNNQSIAFLRNDMLFSHYNNFLIMRHRMIMNLHQQSCMTIKTDRRTIC